MQPYRRVLAIALPALLTALFLYPLKGLEGSVLGGGWVASLLTAVLAVPVLARLQWAKGIANPEDPARAAMRVALQQDAKPLIESSVVGSEGRVLQVVGAVEARMIAEIEGLKASIPTAPDLSPIRQEIAALSAWAVRMQGDLAPVVRRGQAVDANGNSVEVWALEYNLRQIATVLNAATEKLEALPTLIQTTVDEAMTSDWAAKMGEKGRKALEDKIEAAGGKIADRVQWMQEHPEEAAKMAAQGQQLQDVQQVISGVADMFGLPPAIKGPAERIATRKLLERQTGTAGGASYGGGGGGARRGNY